MWWQRRQQYDSSTTWSMRVGWIDHLDRAARGERDDLIESLPEVILIAVFLYITEVGSAHRILEMAEREKRMRCAENRLFIVHVHCREPGPAGAQRRLKSATLDELGTARHGQGRAGFPGPRAGGSAAPPQERPGL